MIRELRKGIIQQSLGLRISLRYSLVLMRSFLLQLLLISVVYWLCVLWNASLIAHDTVHRYVQNYLLKSTPDENAVSDDGTVDIQNSMDVLLPLTDGRLIIDRLEAVFIDAEEDHPPLIVVSDGHLLMTVRVPLCVTNKELSLYTSYSLNDDLRLYGLLAFIVISVGSILVLQIIHRSERINEPALRPIIDIAETAQRLSATNLSERIEVHGARTELKELANVLNDMLDRIESAYNTQKQFVSDASHELRTPIAVIQGYADMLDRWGKDNSEIRDEAIAAIKSETTGMKELVEQLLFIARHDNQTHQYERIYFDISELTEDIIKETKLVAKNHTIHQGDIYRSIICGDRTALKQALRIFVDNAIKYTPEGGSITISCRKEDNLCRITVADTGIGISESELSRIFERFYRSDPARARREDGHGLGLSIARMIVRAHGGHIEVQSKEGQGSRFHILLPL